MSESSIYKLYAYRHTYSMGAHLLLEESGVSYRIIDPRQDPSHTDAEFFRASPHGRVPALILPDGITMCESSAIALHLADSLCEQKYTIKAEDADRGRYLQWLFYLSSTLQPDVLMVFHPEYYFIDSERQAALVQAAERRLERAWIVLEKEYSQKNSSCPWMFECGPTAVDFSLATVMLWPECFPASSQTYPALDAMLKALSERASYKYIMPWHEGLTDDVPHRLPE